MLCLANMGGYLKGSSSQIRYPLRSDTHAEVLTVIQRTKLDVEVQSFFLHNNIVLQKSEKPPGLKGFTRAI